jgi:hypothetical protein
MIFGKIVQLSVVIAAKGGRSCNHKTLRDYWMPAFAGQGMERGDSI